MNTKMKIEVKFMNKLLLVLLGGLLVMASGCDNSPSDSNPPPVSYASELKIYENSLAGSATIFSDATTLNSDNTIFSYGIENYTNKTYSNLVFSLEPANDTLYKVEASQFGTSEPCVSLAYQGACEISVHVNSKTSQTIPFKIKIESDQGIELKTVTPIKSAYFFQPILDRAPVEEVTISNAPEKAFLVYGTKSRNKKISMTGEFTEEVNTLGRRNIGGFTFDSGQTSLQGFSIDNSTARITFSIDGQDQSFKNCLVKGTPDKPTMLDFGEACYVNVKFTNPTAGTYEDNLTIVAPNNVGSAKSAKIKLTGRSN